MLVMLLNKAILGARLCEDGGLDFKNEMSLQCSRFVVFKSYVLMNIIYNRYNI